MWGCAPQGSIPQTWAPHEGRGRGFSLPPAPGFGSLCPCTSLVTESRGHELVLLARNPALLHAGRLWQGQREGPAPLPAPRAPAVHLLLATALPIKST